MIIHSIKLVDWRCFLGEITVEPLDIGLNIVYAPNGTGKSTLFEALRRGLLDGHKVVGKDAEALRPWGRELAPTVSVEFTHKGQDYRITKRFLDNPSALLERKENGRYRRLAEGTAADDQTRDILTKNPPGRGLARLENWGLAQILWAPQGSLAIGPLSGDVVSDIQNMLSAQVSGAGTGPLEKRIEERYSQFFSVKGKIKAGKEAPPLVQLKEQLSAAIEAQKKANSLYMEFEDASRRVEELQARRAQARHDADEFNKALRDTRADAESFRKLAAERDQRSERVAAAEAQYKEQKRLIELIKSTEQDLANSQKALAELEAELPDKDKEIQQREREAAKFKKDLEDIRKDREAVEAAARIANSAHLFNECSLGLGRLNLLISRIEKAETTLLERRQKRNAHIAPDGRTLKAIRKAIKDRDEAQHRIEDSLITLEIVTQENASVEVIAGEKPGLKPVKAGVPVQVQGSPEVVADIARVARLRAWGPVGSIEEYRESRAKAEQRIIELTEAFGTSDPDSLESMLEKAKDLDAEVAEAETKLQTLMAGHVSDDLERERSSLETKLKAYLDNYPDWEETPPDANSYEVEAEKARRDFILRVESAEAARDRAQSALTTVAGQKETLTLRLGDAKQTITSLTSKLTELTSDGKLPKEREDELRRVTMAWEAARARLDEIKEKLREYEDDPLTIVTRLEAQVEAADKEAQRIREQELREETRLDGLCAQGPYSALAVAEEQVAQLEREIRREELKLEAIRLLHDTVAACRTEAIAEVSRPVEAVATRTLQRIAGRRLGRIQVGNVFEAVAVVPESFEQAVTLDNLSGGEQEQLYLATRLALAEVLSKEERQLVVLDDVLTATDSGRLIRVMNVLEEAAQLLQILILTCHPERYRGLKSGRFIDLEEIVRSADKKL